MASRPKLHLEALEGELLGNHRLTKLFARGGMSAVYVGVHEKTRRKNAIKVIDPAVLGSDAARERFIREVQAPAIIDHEGIVHIYDAGTSDELGVSYVVMELLKGHPLRDDVRHGEPWDPDRAIELVAAICDPLAAAHEAGIVHRDLKPENVFVLGDVRDVRLKLIDFGIAKRTGEGARDVTGTGETFGTPWYISPEQLLKPREVGPAADVWALGVMLYELLAGHVPFDAETTAAISIAVCSVAPPPLPRSLPEPLAALVASTLEKDPARRPANARELLTSIQGLGAGTLATTLSDPGRLRRPPVPPTERMAEGQRPKPARRAPEPEPADPPAPAPGGGRSGYVAGAVGLVAFGIAGLSFAAHVFGGGADVPPPPAAVSETDGGALEAPAAASAEDTADGLNRWVPISEDVDLMAHEVTWGEIQPFLEDHRARARREGAGGVHVAVEASLEPLRVPASFDANVYFGDTSLRAALATCFLEGDDAPDEVAVPIETSFYFHFGANRFRTAFFLGDGAHDDCYTRALATHFDSTPVNDFRGEPTCESERHPPSCGRRAAGSLHVHATFDVGAPDGVRPNDSPRMPAAPVPWTIASGYCTSLGAGVRLPSAEEWGAIAHRGGAFPWGDDPPGRSELHAFLGPDALPLDVATTRRDVAVLEDGEPVHDLLGNVPEWTLFGAARPTGAAEGVYHVAVGWPLVGEAPSTWPPTHASELHVLCDGDCRPAEMLALVGFRCARGPPPAATSASTIATPEPVVSACVGVWRWSDGANSETRTVEASDADDRCGRMRYRAGFGTETGGEALARCELEATSAAYSFGGARCTLRCDADRATERCGAWEPLSLRRVP